jgi:hypothetical protein
MHALVFTTVALAALADPRAPQKERPQRGEGVPSCQIEVKSTPASRKTTFSAAAILDLNFRIALPAGSTADEMELKVYTPAGHLYQDLTFPVAAAGSSEVTRDKPGRPFPVKVVHAHRTADGGSSVDAPPFPVGGTLISTNSLFGKWRVEALPAGELRACTASFTITP